MTFIDAKKLRELVPLSPSQVRRLEAAGSFPQRRKVCARRTFWVLEEVLQWMQDRADQRFLDLSPAGRDSNNDPEITD